jgi:threonine synthase
MDVGHPSNFVRMVDLYENDYEALAREIKGYSFTDSETRAAMRHVLAVSDYVLDPHGAVGYLGLKKYFNESTTEACGIFLETAHPAKFKEVVDETLRGNIDVPDPLQKFLTRKKQSIPMGRDFDQFKSYLSSLPGLPA